MAVNGALDVKMGKPLDRIKPAPQHQTVAIEDKRYVVVLSADVSLMTVMHMDEPIVFTMTIFMAVNYHSMTFHELIA
jgi:hypothetical protein